MECSSFLYEQHHQILASKRQERMVLNGLSLEAVRRVRTDRTAVGAKNDGDIP